MVKNTLDIGFFSCMYSQINGTAHAVRFLSEAIAKYTGHRVHVFAPRIENGYKHSPNLHFHDFGGARISPKTGFVLSFPIHKYFFCQEDYLDIAHIHTHATFGTMAINWAKYLGIPMVGTHNSPLQFYAAQYLPVIGKLMTKFDFIWRYERLMCSKYDITHVATPSKKSLLREQKFKEPIICMSNGINEYFFKDIKPNGIMEKYGISKDKKVMLYASRFSPEKHMVSVTRQFKKIKKEVPNAHLLLVGSDGPSKEPVEKLVKRQGMKDYVTVAGRVPFEDLLMLYKAADLSCLWSWIEAEGLVLIEAMAQGTPNIGANGYGISDVIKHGQTGYLANNLNEFADQTIKLFKNDDLRIQLGKNAKQEAQKYRMSQIAHNWVDLYKLAINELYPLRYNHADRNERVKVVKEHIAHLPNVCF